MTTPTDRVLRVGYQCRAARDAGVALRAFSPERRTLALTTVADALAGCCHGVATTPPNAAHAVAELGKHLAELARSHPAALSAERSIALIGPPSLMALRVAAQGITRARSTIWAVSPAAWSVAARMVTLLREALCVAGLPEAAVALLPTRPPWEASRSTWRAPEAGAGGALESRSSHESGLAEADEPGIGIELDDEVDAALSRETGLDAAFVWDPRLRAELSSGSRLACRGPEELDVDD